MRRLKARKSSWFRLDQRSMSSKELRTQFTHLWSCILVVSINRKFYLINYEWLGKSWSAFTDSQINIDWNYDLMKTNGTDSIIFNLETINEHQESWLNYMDFLLFIQKWQFDANVSPTKYTNLWMLINFFQITWRIKCCSKIANKFFLEKKPAQ